MLLSGGLKCSAATDRLQKLLIQGKAELFHGSVPVHIDAPLSEDPELVMVVRRSGDFYEIKTILSYDDELKDRITALSLYSKLW